MTKLSDIIEPKIIPAFFPYISTRRKISPEKDIEEISKRQKKLILFEFINRNQKEIVDNYFKSLYGKPIVYIDNLRSKESFRQLRASLPLDISLPEGVSSITVHSVYFFMDYFTLVFDCNLNLKEFNEHLLGNPADIFNQRLRVYEELQRKIEKLLPDEFHGIFFNNELKFKNSTLNLPSIYVYGLEDYRFIFKDFNNGLTISSPSIRAKANNFLDEFNEYENNKLAKPKFNKLCYLGIRPNRLFAVISDRIIVSQSEAYFQDALKPIPRNFVILDFESTQYFEDTQLLSFIFEFISKYYLLIILEKLLLELIDIQIPKIADIQEDDLLIKKRELLKIKTKLDEINDEVFSYSRIFDYFEKVDFCFNDEETWRNNITGMGCKEHSISDYFKDFLISIKKEIDKRQQNLEKIISDKTGLINTELEFNKDKPIINVLYREIENELVLQIRKWKDKISQEKIEAWLSNFENKSERLSALKLLDKLTFIQNNNIKLFMRSSYNKLLATINRDNLNDCNISSIGGLTIVKFSSNRRLEP